MSHTEWKKEEEEVKYLYTLPLCTLLVTHNWQIIICEANKQKHVHAYKYTHTDTYLHTQIYTYTCVLKDTCVCKCIDVNAQLVERKN